MEMISMNILSILKDKYKECEPIFDYEIYDLGFTDKDIEDTFKYNVFEELNKVDIIPCRIFYLVGYNEKFNIYFRLNKESEDIINKYFIGKDYEFGYVFGLSLQNRVGISTQVPRNIYIKSNRTDKEIKYNYFIIEPDKDYEFGDFKYVQLAEMLKYQDSAEYSLSETINKLKSECTDIQKLKKYEEMT